MRERTISKNTPLSVNAQSWEDASLTENTPLSKSHHYQRASKNAPLSNVLWMLSTYKRKANKNSAVVTSLSCAHHLLPRDL